MSADSDNVWDEEKIDEKFRFSERVIEEAEKDASSAKTQENLRTCVDKLQQLSKQIDQLALFSTNDQIEELPTNSLQYLLVPAYLAFAIENINSGIEKRATYLKAAQLHYRAYLERLLIYDIIAFKLPWVKTDENDLDSESTSSAPPRREDPSMRRTGKVERLKQEKALELNLAKLKAARKREEDESTLREILIVQMRLWAIKTMKQLDLIDDELKILEHMEKIRSGEIQAEPTTAQKPASKSLNTFIIAKSEAQKKVFGLGYPSIPTVTVDEWFDQMQKTGHFSGLNKPITIKGQEDEEKPDSDEDDSEEARQKKMRWDEFKDDNMRGTGNTYNKG
uniref:TAP42-like protein n=1 Tax=Acrobeloides nanus TaxID=290746 RepID=A0A914DCH5_9BILA